MNKLIVAILIISGNVSMAQSTNWDWAMSHGGIHNDEGRSITSDTNGNVYATGNFQSPSISFGANTHINADTSGLQPLNIDIFIVKYDPTGNILWSQSAGGILDDVGTSIVTDANDNVYMSGYFISQTINFGGNILTNSGSTSFFIVKYNSSGDVIWAKSANGSAIGKGLSVDNIGNVYVTGIFNSSQIIFDTIALTNYGGWDIFITKFDTNGNAIWSKSCGSINDEKSESIKVNISGDMFITGQFCSPSVLIGSSTLTNTGGNDAYGDFFIAKYDSMGNPIWAQSAGGGGMYWDSGYGVSSDNYGNAYVIAEFCSPSITVGNFVLNNIAGSNNNIFIAKYDSNGTAIWAKCLGLSQNQGFGIDSDGNGNVYAISNFGGQINLGNVTLNYSGGYDIFIVKYDTQGNVIWASSIGEPLWDYGNSICVDNLNQVYITGSFYENNIDFGTTTLNNLGVSDIYIAKISQNNLGIISQDFKGNKIIIYPNPSKKNINIKGIIDKSTINIYDQNGKMIITKETFSDVSIDIEKLPVGIYYIMTQTEKKTELTTFVKE